MNKADNAACAVTAEAVAQQLREHQIKIVKVETGRKYHGRAKTFIDTLRRLGGDTMRVQ